MPLYTPESCSNCLSISSFPTVLLADKSSYPQVLVSLADAAPLNATQRARLGSAAFARATCEGFAQSRLCSIGFVKVHV